MLRVNSPLITTVICADDQCNVNCRTWTALIGQCASDAIIDGGTITLYSDSNCSTIIPGSDNIPVLLSGECNVLLSNIYSRHIGSYKVTQASPYSPIIAFLFISAMFCWCAVCWCAFYCCLCCVDKREQRVIRPAPTATAPRPTATAPTATALTAVPLLYERFSEDPQ